MVLTIRDVAQAAGVSASTVSRALRGLDNVDAHTRARVVRVAREMNFSVSQTASRLATGRTGTVGIVTPFVGRWYFTEIFAGLAERLQAHDVDLLMHVTEPTAPHTIGSLRQRLARRVDGALIIGLPENGPELQELGDLDLPMVLLGAVATALPSVAIDDRRAARTAVEHLIALGHERIALISGRPLPTRFLPENERLAGYLDALEAYGLDTADTLRAVGMFTTPGGEQAMEELLARDLRATAVFCMSDEMAYGAMRAMTRHGVRVGPDRDAGEVAVVGFDGHDLADVFDLTTMSQPVRGLGSTAASLLIDHIAAGSPPRAVVLPTELVVRGSTVRSVP